LFAVLYTYRTTTYSLLKSRSGHRPEAGKRIIRRSLHLSRDLFRRYAPFFRPPLPSVVPQRLQASFGNATKAARKFLHSKGIVYYASIQLAEQP